MIHNLPILHGWMWKKTTCGLKNLGNTCFLASLIQCLQHIPAWINFILLHHAQNCTQLKKDCIICILARLAAKCHSSTSPIAPCKLVSSLSRIGKHLTFGRQEDAHDFFLCLITKMQESLTSVFKNVDIHTEMTTAVGQIFGGYFSETIMCNYCRKPVDSYEPYYCVSLDIAENINSCIELLVTPNTLNREKWYNCKECQTKRNATKCLAFHKLPNVLALHLKRYEYQDGRLSKNLGHVGFEDHLDLKPYVSLSSNEVDCKYELSSVLVHHGYSMTSGHYTAYVSVPSESTNGRSWFCMNDNFVTSVKWSDVRKSEAYMLFYTRSMEETKMGMENLNDEGISIVSDPEKILATWSEEYDKEFTTSFSDLSQRQTR